MHYPWYTKLESSDKSIEQGDFIENCPLLIPPANVHSEEPLEVELKEIDTIVLSKSFDLINNKIQVALVCPFYSLSGFISNLPKEQQGVKAHRKHIDNLKKGHLPGYHLLEKEGFDIFKGDYQVVDFRNVYGIHVNALRSLISSESKIRVRLLPPYREHLSQSFARYFMRVGLPQDINIEGY